MIFACFGEYKLICDRHLDPNLQICLSESLPHEINDQGIDTIWSFDLKVVCSR